MTVWAGSGGVSLSSSEGGAGDVGVSLSSSEGGLVGPCPHTLLILDSVISCIFVCLDCFRRFAGFGICLVVFLP